MAVGQGSLYSGESYIAFGRETAYGSYDTCTAGLDPQSVSIKTLKDSVILPEIQRKRTMSRVFQVGKTVEGPIEFNFYPEVTACGFMLQNAFGGTVTSATVTGETTGGAGMTHTFKVGSFDQSYTSICINHRKGPSGTGKIFEYSGGRINTLAMVAELDNPLRMTATFIFKDATVTANDVESALTITAAENLSFADGRLSIESSFASLTSSSYWHVQNINFTLNNNLKNDANSRRIGSDTLDVLPPGVQNYELSCQVRFDTTTAFDAMIEGTEFAGEFDFLGSTMAGSAAQRGLKVRMQKLTIKDAGDPEVTGPDDQLMSTVTFNVLRDESASGYAVQAELTNLISGYT